MRVAINKEILPKVKNKKDNDYIYLFDEEPLEELLKLKIHCMHKDYANKIDVNLTDFDINCIIKAKYDDEEWKGEITKKEYKYAIIIPNYNNDHGEYKKKTFLRNCIDSILNQTYRNFELIIIDDCSTDTSIETIESYKDKRIHLLKNTRKRYNGGSRNVGIDYALNNLNFDYFCFLDSDDWWKDEEVLETINNKLYNHEMLTIACEMVGKNNTIMYTSPNKAKCYEDLWSMNNNLWCTAWARVIRKDKIVYFCEDTLMEDRVWTYRLADGLNYNKVTHVDKVCYCWNRTNTTQSVSIVRNDFWNASAYCHIGHQIQLITQLKHKEMIPKIEARINVCKRKINKGEYQQY